MQEQEKKDMLKTFERLMNDICLDQVKSNPTLSLVENTNVLESYFRDEFPEIDFSMAVDYPSSTITVSVFGYSQKEKK